VVFQIRGETGQATLLKNVISSSQDWRDSKLGRELITYTAANKYGPLSKIGSDLAEVFIEYEIHRQTGGNLSTFKPENSLIQIRDGYVVIDAIASTSVAELLTDLKRLGLQQSASFQSVVSGILPVESLNQIANLSSLRFAKPAYRVIPDAGSVDTQGNISLNANNARTRFNVNGTGITVGVLSDSYNIVTNDLTNEADDIISNDLPGANNTNGFTTPVRVLQEGSGALVVDEGRAMLQIIHDVAPGANLAFHTASNGSAAYAQGILALANSGANIIVDDVRLLDEPMFQDGIIAQAVDIVFDRGIPYFASAGNYGGRSYESSFRSGPVFAAGTATSGFGPNGPNFAGGTAHDFNPGVGVDEFQQITIPAGMTVTFSFQWDEPYSSDIQIGGPVVNGVGSSSDLDIYIFDNNFGTPAAPQFPRLLAWRTNNNVGREPSEVLTYTNSATTDRQFNVMIVRNTASGGADPGLIKYVIRSGSAMNPSGRQFIPTTIDEYDTLSGTGYGHSSARGAEAVGAADVRDIATDPLTGNATTATLEQFSSVGPIRILFDKAGNRLPTPEIRLKPEIVAPDGVNTTFFGEDTTGSNGDSDTFPNFFGTSAAAPHAAAVAALMLQAVPGSSPTNIYKALEETALDMGTPGVDNASGYGLIQADRAIQRLRELGTPTISIRAIDASASETQGANDTAQFEITRTGGNINRDILVNYRFDGTARNGIDYVESGSNNLPANPLDGSILIPSGVSSVVIPITATDDQQFEADETLTITLVNASPYNLDPDAANRQADITIVSDDVLSRRLIVSGSFYGVDDESIGEADVPITELINQPTVISFSNRGTPILDKKISWGEELRAEIYLTGTVLDEAGNIEVNGSVKLFEGTSEDTDDLAASQDIKFSIPRGQIFSPTKIRLENVGFFGGTDFAEFYLNFDNALGNNDDGFSGYP
jgi:Subtilase family/Calx-beta domain